MEFDQENTYWKANCLAHDVYDIFSMMADCALEPRSVPSANIGIDKIKHEHLVDKQLGTQQEFNDHLFSTAYGLHGLGLPLKGLHHSNKYLIASVLQKF